MEEPITDRVRQKQAPLADRPGRPPFASRSRRWSRRAPRTRLRIQGPGPPVQIDHQGSEPTALLLRRILNEPRSDEAWREIRKEIPTVLLERERIRREG